jgi:hypothetical protein
MKRPPTRTDSCTNRPLQLKTTNKWLFQAKETKIADPWLRNLKQHHPARQQQGHGINRPDKQNRNTVTTWCREKFGLNGMQRQRI